MLRIPENDEVIRSNLHKSLGNKFLMITLNPRTISKMILRISRHSIAKLAYAGAASLILPIMLWCLFNSDKHLLHI